MTQAEKDFRFCPACGNALRLERTPYARFWCSRCEETRYLMPKVGAAMIIEQPAGIVLAKRAHDPFQGQWTLPSGYLEYEESCEECAVREAQEETGLGIRIRRLQKVYSFQDDPRSHMVLVVYECEVVGGVLQAGSDVSEVRIFARGELPKPIAFSGIRQAIEDYGYAIDE